MKSKFKRLIVYDLETGGFDANKNPLVEFAAQAIDLETLEVLEEVDWLVKPHYDKTLKYTKRAMETHGITFEEMETDGLDIKTVLDNMEQFFLRHNKPILSGHKIDTFDTPFIDTFLQRFDKDITQMVNLDFSIDTLDFAHLRWTNLAKYNLGACCNEIGVKLIDAHRAVNDVRANAQLTIDMIRALRGLNVANTVTEKKRKAYKLPI